MHRIYWDAKQVGMLTNQIDAAKHKHWMLQMFYHPRRQLQLKVNGETVHGTCILVGSDVVHEFLTGDDIHLSLLIEVTSDIAQQLIENYLKEDSYVDLSRLMGDVLIELYEELVEKKDINAYRDFCKGLYQCLMIHESSGAAYDERILDVFQILERAEEPSESDPMAANVNLSVKDLAERVALSPSRLAHLFKEETGIPLKSYLVLHKIYHAFYLLLHGVNVTNASMEAGFDSPSHLASTTKAMMGTSAKIAIKDSDFLKVSPWKI